MVTLEQHHESTWHWSALAATARRCRMNKSHSNETRILRIVAWFLAVFYIVGVPVVAYLEFHDQLLSHRFDLPATLIYFTCVVQILCAPALLVRKLAPWAAVALSVITIGAIGSHLRIGSPVTTIPALIATATQVWFGVRSIFSQE